MATWHLREAWEAFQISGPTSDLLNQNPNFNKIPQDIPMYIKEYEMLLHTAASLECGKWQALN